VRSLMFSSKKKYRIVKVEQETIDQIGVRCVTCSEEEFRFAKLVFVLVFDQLRDDVGASRPTSKFIIKAHLFPGKGNSHSD